MASSRQSWLDSPHLKKKEDTEELLVFGYSCKLFRDDEKALYIDQGKHLIPWMGDESLKIDRYDVRGTVYDLRPLEPLPGGATEALWSSLSDADRRVEQLCDEERYRALHHNEAEEALYQEEELKRLHKALDPQNSYGQVAYSYDNEGQSESSENKSTENNEAEEEEDEPFVPPPELDIPVGMVVPERTKLNAIIVKTALFISNQGPQMEIVIKIKQASNPQFSFLSIDCPLHPYYRHLLMAIKTGRYRPQQDQKEEEKDTDSSEHYLHPSLAAATSRVELAPSIPSISYKPSADCAYSMLVNKIKDKQNKTGSSSPQSLGAHSSRVDGGDGRSRRRKKEDESKSRSSSDDGTSSSDDENSDTGQSQAIVLPPADVQVIIDKMASYVLKNGRDFESVVRSKGDQRFGFLDPGHEFHSYYEHKIRVYQGLEPPLAPGSVPSHHEKKKKKAKKASKAPKKSILLPGYDYSDDSSQSDEESNMVVNGKSKPKLTPVSFSIKKPKEADILKEVRSALPIEEESSGEENSQPATETNANPKPNEVKAGFNDKIDTNLLEETEKLRALLKMKEQQLREKERLEKLAEKRNQDIFQIGDNDGSKMDKTLKCKVVQQPVKYLEVVSKQDDVVDKCLDKPEDKFTSAPNSTVDKIPILESDEIATKNVEKTVSPTNFQSSENLEFKLEEKINHQNFQENSLEIKGFNESSCGKKNGIPETSKSENVKIDIDNGEKKNITQTDALPPLQPNTSTNLIAHNDEEYKPADFSNETNSQQHSLPEKEIKKSKAERDLEVITEAEIIDLTDDADDVPKYPDSKVRMERKRKAAAFLTLIKKDSSKIQKPSRNESDSDSSSKRSTPSPPPPPKIKTSSYNGASIPRTSLMDRLAASTVIQRSTTLADKRKTGHDKTRSRMASESPTKSSRSETRSSSSRHKRKQRRRDSSSDRSRSRSRSRSVSHSKSPSYKRRTVDDSDSDRRSHKLKHHTDHRRKFDSTDEASGSGNSRHHRRHKESRHSHGHSKKTYEPAKTESNSDSSDE